MSVGGAEIVGARLVDAAGAAREQFLAGEPLALELQVTAREPTPGAGVHVELRDAAGLLVADDHVDLGTLGWDGSPGTLPVRLELGDPPLQFGRFRLQVTLLDGDGRLLQRVDEGLPLLVYPDGESRGLVRLGGTWRGGAKEGTR